MCGRAYSTITEEELEVRYHWQKRKKNPLGLKPNYNMCPTQKVPVVFIENHDVEIKPMRWGLVPGWAKSIQDASKYSLINAKGEEINEKRSYKSAFQKRRCIVPLSGFIEWKRDSEKSKRPFAIHLKDSPIMSVAGVWEHWENNDEVVDSFSIITTSANSFMKRIHDRMPVILSPEQESQWLDPTNTDSAKLMKFLKPCPDSWLDAYELSTMINSPKNNRKEVLEPVK